MPPSERLIDDLADAILDGSPIDWAAAESSSDGTAQLLVGQLRVLAAVADLHRSTPPSPSTLSQIPPSRVEPKVADAPAMWSHLRLVERIGRGAFGEVYRAWDTRLDREVALKLLPADRSPGNPVASSIIHEGRLLARVRHPNVVTIYGAEQIGRPDRPVDGVRSRPHSRANPRPTEGGQRCRSCRDRSRALSRGIGGARCRPAASGYQGAQRDASRRRAHRAHGLRHWQRARRRRIVGSGRNATLSRTRGAAGATSHGSERHLQSRRPALSPRHRLVSGAGTDRARGSPCPRTRRADRCSDRAARCATEARPRHRACDRSSPRAPLPKR